MDERTSKPSKAPTPSPMTSTRSTRAAAGPVRGEITVVLAGAAPTLAPPVDTLVGAVQERMADGERLKDAVRVVAEAAGVGKRELYAATLAGRELDGAGSTS